MTTPPKKEFLTTSFLLFLILVVAFYDIVFLNKTFKASTVSAQAVHTGAYGQENNKLKFFPVIGTDTPVFEEPVLEFIKQNLRRGILPLWDPHQAGGTPLIGMIEIGLFFPLNLIMYLLPQEWAWDILILSRIFLAGLLTYWFMRSIGFTKIPSIISAIAFMLSGPMLLLQYWTANVDILTPLLLLTLERLIRRPQFTNAALVGLVVGLTFLAGHPEHIFLVNTYGFLFFVYRSLSLYKGTDLKERFTRLGSAHILGFSLSAIVLFPFLQNLYSEFWHAHPPGVGLFMEEQRDRFLTLALPHFFQKAPVLFDWTFAGWWGGYIGTLPLALAILSLFNRHKRGLSYFFVGIAFLIISKEYGLFFINWIGTLPVFNVCRYAIHTPHLAAFSVAVAAGMGARTILLRPHVFVKALPFTLVLLLTAAAHFEYQRSSLDLSFAVPAFCFAAGLLVVFQILLWAKDKGLIKRQVLAVAIVVLLTVELFSYIHRERPRRFNSFGKVPYIEFLKSQKERNRVYGMIGAFYPNTGTGFEVDDLGIFMSLIPKRFVNFTNALIQNKTFVDDLRPPALRALPINTKYVLDLLNVRYTITPPADFMSRIVNNYKEVTKGQKPVYEGEVLIWERPGAFPRAFIAHRAIFEADEKKTLDILNVLQSQLRNIAVIKSTSNPHILNQLKNAPLTTQSTANVTQYSANEVTIEARLDYPGFLVLSDAFHPDWKAFVNGEPAVIYQTDYLLRSVFLPAGEHKIKFVFAPASFYVGAAISLLALLRILLLLGLNRFKNKKP